MKLDVEIDEARLQAAVAKAVEDAFVRTASEVLAERLRQYRSELDAVLRESVRRLPGELATQVRNMMAAEAREMLEGHRAEMRGMVDRWFAENAGKTMQKMGERMAREAAAEADRKSKGRR
jgi:peptidyl-tRNA hydrolase